MRTKEKERNICKAIGELGEPGELFTVSPGKTNL
jgi:hypothetical protein